MNINIESEDDDYYGKNFKEEISPRTNYGDGFLEDEDDVNKIINNNESRESISTYRDNRLD